MIRLFLMAALLCLGTFLPSAHATPVTKDMANNYYAQCLQGEAPNLSPETQNTMCACTAAQMMQSMSVEDIQTMAKQHDAARVALNKMIVVVYAPCIQYPAKDHYYSACIQNPKTAQLSRNPQALCGCLSDKVANYLAQNSVSVFEDLLTRNPTLVDPMTALTSDPKFETFAQSQLLSCL